MARCACARWDARVRASDSHAQSALVTAKDPFRINTAVLFQLHGTEMDAASAMREIKGNFLSSRGYISEY